MSGEKKAVLYAFCDALTLAAAAVPALALTASLLARAGMPFSAAYAASVFAAIVGTLAVSRGRRTLIALPSPAVAAWLVYEEIIARGFSWQEILGIAAVVSLVGSLVFRSLRGTDPTQLLPPIVRTGLVLGLGFSMLVTACLYARVLLPSPWALTMGGTLSDPLAYYTLIGILLILALHTVRVRSAVCIGVAVIGTLTLIEGFWEIPAAPFLLPEGLDKTVGALSLPLTGVSDALALGLTLFFALCLESGAVLAAEDDDRAPREERDRAMPRLLAVSCAASLLGAFPLSIAPMSAVLPAHAERKRIGGIPLTACMCALILAALLPCAPLVEAIADFPAVPAIALGFLGLALFARGLRLLQRVPDPVTLRDAAVLAIFFLACYDIKTSLSNALLLCVLLGIVRGEFWKTNRGACVLAGVLFIFFLLKYFHP